MAEASGDLVYEIPKNRQQQMTNVELVLVEHSKELQALRGRSASTQTDMHNTYGVLHRVDSRLDRIDVSLELREYAQRPQDPYQPA